MVPLDYPLLPWLYSGGGVSLLVNVKWYVPSGPRLYMGLSNSGLRVTGGLDLTCLASSGSRVNCGTGLDCLSIFLAQSIYLLPGV